MDVCRLQSWDASGGADGVITVGDDSSAYEGILISQLQIDGDKSSYTNSNNHGIYARDQISKSQVKSTWVYNNAGTGILASADFTEENTDNIIEGNDIRNNTLLGISLVRSLNTTVSNNTVSGNTSIGIQVSLSEGTRVNANVVDSNGGIGIVIQGNQNHVTVTGNTAKDNTGTGIDVYGNLHIISNNSPFLI